MLLFGDTDEGQAGALADEFDARPSAVVHEMWTGGVSLPWNLAAAAVVGLWLMFTRLTLGTEGGMANADHVIGALALTVISLYSSDATFLDGARFQQCSLAVVKCRFFLRSGEFATSKLRIVLSAARRGHTGNLAQASRLQFSRRESLQ